MSRAYKNTVFGSATLNGATGLTTANVETISGAELDQIDDAGRGVNLTNPGIAGGATSLGALLQANKIATVTADGVNTVTVDNLLPFFVGRLISIYPAAGGAARITGQTVSAIAPGTGVITYGGADASANIVAGDIVVQHPLRDTAALSGADVALAAGS